MRFDWTVALRDHHHPYSAELTASARMCARRHAAAGNGRLQYPAMVMTKRVLIVEDDRDLRDMLATLLDLEGFETIAAPNGEVALGLLDPWVDAIVLDLMMPVMDGWEFRRRQMSHPRTADIPVIVVSAVHAERHGGSVSCAAHLAKPIDFDRLIRTLAFVCRTTPGGDARR